MSIFFKFKKLLFSSISFELIFSEVLVDSLFLLEETLNSIKDELKTDFSLE